MGRRSKWEDKIIKILMYKPMAYKEIKSSLGISDRVLNYNLRKLMRDGRVVKAGRKYLVNPVTAEEAIKTTVLELINFYKLNMWSPYVYIFSKKPLRKYKNIFHPALCSSIWSWMTENLDGELISEVAKVLRTYSKLSDDKRSLFISNAMEKVDLVFITNAFSSPPPVPDTVGYYDVVRCIFGFFKDIEAKEEGDEWLFKEGIEILKRLYDRLRDMKFLVIYNVDLEGLNVPYTLRACEYHDQIIEWIDREADEKLIKTLKKVLKEILQGDIESIYRYDIPPDIREMLIYITSYRQRQVIKSILDHIENK